MGSTIAPQQTNQGCSHVIFNYTLNYSIKKEYTCYDPGAG